VSRLIDRLTQRAPQPVSITDWSKMFRPGAQFSYNGMLNQAFNVGSAQDGALYDSNSVVFAVTANRILLLSEVRFLYQRLRNSRPTDLFGDTTLAIMEEPWPGASTRELLAQAELDITCSGNSYWVRDGDHLLRLDPQYVKLITVGAYDELVTGYQIGERLAAYMYVKDPQRPVVFLPDQIAHYRPYPDQSNRFLGKSWLSSCISDVNSDSAITTHKQSTLGSGANLRYAVTFDPDINENEFEFFVDFFRKNYEGPENAGKTLMLGGGADVKTVGQTFEGLAMKAITDSSEARIAACAGVPPVIAGLIPGLDSSTYSNYGQARRRLADATLRPLWGFFASAFSSVVDVPSDARLWYDDRDVPFLREDVGDQAKIAESEMTTITAGVTAGFTPESVVAATSAGDWTLLEHSGKFSVQLQSEEQMKELEARKALPAPNGKATAPVAP